MAKRGSWSNAGSHWTFIQSPDGDESNLFPPKSVQASAVPGEEYQSRGKTYQTYVVLAPDHIGQPKKMFNAGLFDSSIDEPAKRTTQQVVVGMDD